MALDTMTLEPSTQDAGTTQQAFIDNAVKVTVRVRITPDALRYALSSDYAHENYIDHVGPQFADILEYRLQRIFNVDNLDAFVQVDFVQNRQGLPAEEVVSSSQEIQSLCEETVDSVKEDLKDILAHDSEFDWEDRYERELFYSKTATKHTKTSQPLAAA